MITMMIVFGMLFILFWVGFKITGAVLKALLWLVFLLPFVLCVWAFGFVLCCTLILIPIGIKLIGFGANVLFS